MIDILDIKMQGNDAGAGTVREYLKALLTALWDKQEGFSGKRPFGNSGWSGDLAFALVQAGAIEGRIETDGTDVDLADYDEPALDRAVRDAIAAL